MDFLLRNTYKRKAFLLFMKEKIFNIIQIGDKSNKISRAFDIFITIIIVGNIIVTFLETFDQLSSFSGLFKIVEIVTVFVFCVEYILRIWTANYLYPEVTAGHPYYSFNTYAKNWFYYTIALYCTQENITVLTPKNKKRTADTYTRTVLLLPKSLTAVFTSFSEAVLRLFLPQSYMT